MYLTLHTLPSFLKCAEMRSFSHSPTVAMNGTEVQGAVINKRARPGYVWAVLA